MIERSGRIHVFLTHTTLKGWDRLYREYRDTDTLVLATVDRPTWPILKWDLLQLLPPTPNMPDTTHHRLLDLWQEYLNKPGIRNRKPLWGSCNVYGHVPMHISQMYPFSLAAKDILESIPRFAGIERYIRSAP